MKCRQSKDLPYLSAGAGEVVGRDRNLLALCFGFSCLVSRL